MRRFAVAVYRLAVKADFAGSAFCRTFSHFSALDFGNLRRFRRQSGGSSLTFCRLLQIDTFSSFSGFISVFSEEITALSAPLPPSLPPAKGAKTAVFVNPQKSLTALPALLRHLHTF